MKHSIRTRLIIMLTLLLVCMIMALLCVNRIFFASFYENRKVAMMEKVFREVDNIYLNEVVTPEGENDTDSEGEGDAGSNEQDGQVEISNNLSETLERMEANNGVSLSIFQFADVYGFIVIDYIFSTSNDKLQARTTERIEEIIQMPPVLTNSPGELMKRKDNYFIYKSYDERMGSQYLEYFGKLTSGDWFYMRSNYESMKESVAIANQFLGYIGAIVTLNGIVLMFFIGRSFTKPILNLSDIAERISKLDFEAKYNEARDDEIGILGNSMNSLSDKLERTISELKSANNELQSDIERKTQLEEMRQEFLSNVSHELKTPIALIQGYAEGLQENVNDDPESRKFYCEVIIDEANKMNRMVKRLLDLNQLEFGYDKVQFEHFDIVEVIRSVLSASEILFKQKGVTLVFGEEEPVYVWAEEYFIEEVFTNYISNALNHVEEPNRIEVKLLRKEDVVRIVVFNTGRPVPEEESDKIWEKFYKVDKSRTREYGGNGIGLSIVKAIMTSLNQEYGFTNREDGVEFWFELDIVNG